MRCFECGYLNSAGARICVNCGKQMTKQLITLEGHSPSAATNRAGYGFHPARITHHDTIKTENESARTPMKADRTSEQSSAAPKSAFHPARLSTAGLSPKSPLPDTAGSRESESVATSDAMKDRKSIRVLAGMKTAIDGKDSSVRAPWFHAASLHHADRSIKSDPRAMEQEKSSFINELETAKRAWRTPRPFDIRGTNRFFNDTPIEEIMIEPPPKIDRPFRANWKSVLFAPAMVLLLFATLLAMVLLMRASSLTFYIVLIAVMLGIGLLGGTAEYLLQALQWRADQERKKLNYIEYLETLEYAWNMRAERQLQTLNLQNPSIEGCIAFMESRSERIWERTQKDDDFLCVRVGRGERAFELGILMSPTSFEEREAELHTQMRALVEAHRSVSPAPVLLDLKMKTMIGILGNSAETSSVIQNIIIQLATFHSPQEVEIILLGADRKDTDWAKISQLPHIHRAGETDGAEASAMRSELEKRIRMLHQPDHDAEGMEKRFLVLFLLQGGELTESDFETLPLLAKRAKRICVIVQSASQTRFPMQTELILKVANRDGEIYRNQSDETPQQICLDSISTEQMSRFLGALHVHPS